MCSLIQPPCCADRSPIARTWALGCDASVARTARRMCSTVVFVPNARCGRRRCAPSSSWSFVASRSRPAHGAPILDARAKLDEYLEHRLERERQVLAAWSAGLRSAGQIVPEVYADTPPALHPLAGRQVLAHLERLHRRGAIDGPPPVVR